MLDPAYEVIQLDLCAQRSGTIGVQQRFQPLVTALPDPAGEQSVDVAATAVVEGGVIGVLDQPEGTLARKMTCR